MNDAIAKIYLVGVIRFIVYNSTKCFYQTQNRWNLMISYLLGLGGWAVVGGGGNPAVGCIRGLGC